MAPPPRVELVLGKFSPTANLRQAGGFRAYGSAVTGVRQRTLGGGLGLSPPLLDLRTPLGLAMLSLLSLLRLLLQSIHPVFHPGYLILGGEKKNTFSVILQTANEV